jgi:hypothetical protein
MYLTGGTKLKEKSHQWLELFNSKNSVSNVFNAINL